MLTPASRPRQSQANLYLSMYSGTDVALLNGLMHHIMENGWEDSAFISERTKNFEEMKAVVMQETYSLPNVSKITGVPEEDIKTGVVFIPFHFKECAANILTIGALDPVAKIPEYKACAVKIEKILPEEGRIEPEEEKIELEKGKLWEGKL